MSSLLYSSHEIVHYMNDKFVSLTFIKRCLAATTIACLYSCMYEAQRICCVLITGTAEYILDWWDLTSVEGASLCGNGSNLKFSRPRHNFEIQSLRNECMEMLPKINGDHEIVYNFCPVSA